MTLSKGREERQAEVGGRLAEGERVWGSILPLTSQTLTNSRLSARRASAKT